MKPHSLLPVAALLASALPTEAQTILDHLKARPKPQPVVLDSTRWRYRHVAKLGIDGGASASYETKLGRRFSLETGIGFWTQRYRGYQYIVTDSGFTRYELNLTRMALGGVQSQVRYYLQQQKPSLVGWYLSAGLGVKGDYERRENDNNGSVIKRLVMLPYGRLRFGRQFQLGPRFTADFNVGPELVSGWYRDWEYNRTLGTAALAENRTFHWWSSGGAGLLLGYRF